MKFTWELLEKLEDARTDLYVFGFLTFDENKKIQNRIKKWAERQGVALVVQPQLSSEKPDCRNGGE